MVICRPCERLKNDRQPLAEVFVLPDPAEGVQPAPETVWARIGERVIVGNLATQDVVSLDGSAADMWEALVNEDSEEAALATLSTLYDVDPAALRKDLLTFVDDLRQRRLLV